MATPLAILIGSAIIATAIIFTFRWEIALGSGHPPVVRLDRWTGTVTACNADPDMTRKASQNYTALDMDCVAP
jgi:hypothetical protein